MNYPQSQAILEKIKSAKKILVNLHRGPDADSMACALSLYFVLKDLGKDVDVVCVASSQIPSDLLFMKGADAVKRVDYSKFDFNKYDLFISPDSGSWQQVVDNKEVLIPQIPIVVIDHHATNEKFGQINLIEESSSSCAEMVDLILEDWNINIDKSIAELLLTGIIGDTGGFAFYNSARTLKIAGELVEKGADKVGIIKKIFRTKKFEEIKMWGEFLVRIEFDEQHKFVWTAIPLGVYEKHGKPAKVSSSVAGQFLSIIDGSDFGIAMLEKDGGVLDVSFRSRGSIDVAKLAKELDGGGNKETAGGKVEGLPFEKAVEKVLETARAYAKKV